MSAEGWTINVGDLLKGKGKEDAAATISAPAADGTPASGDSPTPSEEEQEVLDAAARKLKEHEERTKEVITDPTQLWFAKESKVPTHTYEVREHFLHDPTAFTQGLEMYDEGFIEGTGEYGRSQLRKTWIDGKVYSKISNSKKDFGEGITVFGKHVLQLTWREKKAYLYDRHTLNHEGGFDIDYEGWGATHDDERVYISDGTNTIRWIIPPPKGDWTEEVKQVKLKNEDGEEITEVLWKTEEGVVIKIPIRLNELEVVEGELWANLWPTETIARIEIDTGKLLGFIDLRGLRADAAKVPNPYPICRMDVLNGIAVDKDDEDEIHVYVTGKCWPRMYDLQIMEREDCGFKGELLSLPQEEMKPIEVIDFFKPEVIGGKKDKGSDEKSSDKKDKKESSDKEDKE